MPLRLQVVSAHRESMGTAYIQEFAACGGTIGRSLGCDWPLPDSKRYVSSRHAMIDYQSSAYYLVDLSRNGVFLNGSNTPVGKGNPRRLFDGDSFRLGEFEINVAIIDDPSEADDDGMRDSVVRAQLVPEDDSIEMAMLAPEQLSDSGSLEDLLETQDMSEHLSMLTERSPITNQQDRQLQSVNNMEAAAAIFLKAAGMNPQDFAGIDPVTLLQNAAQIMAEYTEGVHTLLRKKDDVTKNMSHRDLAAVISNPLRASDGIDNALRLLLAPGNDVHMTGATAVNEAFKELLQHQTAIMNAMRNALDDYLGYFEPDALEQLFSQQQQRTGRSPKDFRELYSEAFKGLARPNRNKLPQRFDEEFSRAYELETTD